MCFELDDDLNDCLCQALMCFGCCYLCKKCCCGDTQQQQPVTHSTVVVHQPVGAMYDPNQQGQWQQQQHGGYAPPQGFPLHQPGQGYSQPMYDPNQGQWQQHQAGGYPSQPAIGPGGYPIVQQQASFPVQNQPGPPPGWNPGNPGNPSYPGYPTAPGYGGH